MYDIIELSRKLLPDLKEIAKELDIKKIESFKKQDLIYLIYKILDTQAILASEKKSDDKKLKSPRDINPKREESSVFKLFSRKKEEKPAEITEEKPADKTETEMPATSSENEPRKEGKRELQIKKRPRTEHIKAGSSNHNPNQNPNAKQNINPNQRQNPNQNQGNNQKQNEQPKFNQNQKVRQDILFSEDSIETESETIVTEPIEEQVTQTPNQEFKIEQQTAEETRPDDLVEKRNENQNKKNNPKWENRDNQGPKPQKQQNI